MNELQEALAEIAGIVPKNINTPLDIGPDDVGNPRVYYFEDDHRLLIRVSAKSPRAICDYLRNS